MPSTTNYDNSSYSFNKNRSTNIASLVIFGLLIVFAVYLFNTKHTSESKTHNRYSVSFPVDLNSASDDHAAFSRDDQLQRTLSLEKKRVTEQLEQVISIPQTTKTPSNNSLSSLAHHPIHSTIRNGYELHYKRFPIHHSLYRAVYKAGLTHQQRKQLLNLFGSKNSVLHVVHPNDAIEILYEVTYKNGKKIKTGNIVAANYIHHNKTTLSAIRFHDGNHRIHYYSAKGSDLHQTFLRYPVHFTRISSHFSLHRFHPILHRYLAHTGVDLAAPRGTPIRATADGAVTLAGRDGGYGRAVFIKHNSQYSTRYAHMRRIAKGVHIGKHIKQGQVIGYVGESGRANGPHLHYEVRVNGEPKNPLKIKLPRIHYLAQKLRKQFKRYSNYLLARLKSYHRSL